MSSTPSPRSTRDVTSESTSDEARDQALLERAFHGVLSAVQESQCSQSGQLDDVEKERLDKAFALAKEAHAGQRRRSGEPYLVHPLRVARTIARLGLDLSCVIAGILHDSVEDSELTLVELSDHCGPDVARLVDGVTKLGKLPFLDRQQRQVESFRKFVLAMSQDLRVLLLKLADRLDNMRTLEVMPAKKRARIARETLEIYAPLASRLGVDVMRRELQNLSFRYCDPVHHREVSERMQKVLDEDPGFSQRALEQFRHAFEGGEGSSWDKTTWGAVRIVSRHRTAAQVHWSEKKRHERAKARDGHGAARELRLGDLVTLQLITDSRESCYLALGHLHANFRSRSRNVRDFISVPRHNRYQALHTEVLLGGSEPLFVEICSGAMHEIAERGVVFDLKQGRPSDPATMQWLRQVSDSHSKLQDPDEYFAAVRDELFSEEVYVSTPKGEHFALPSKSTPIDFAFFIHTEVGLHCSGARVNGQFVPLRYQLRSGDSVEILTDPRVRPRSEWLKMCASSRARTRISQYLRQTERERHLQLGQDLLRQALQRRGLSVEDLSDVPRFDEILGRWGLARDRGLAPVQEAVGAKLLDVDAFLDDAVGRRSEKKGGFLARVFSRDNAEPTPVDRALPVLITRDRLEGLGVSSMRLSPCCSPVPGDPVTGVVQHEGEIDVHRSRCPEVLSSGRKHLRLAWDEELRMECPVVLEVISRNTEGLLAQMSRTFAEFGVNIRQANCRVSDVDNRATNTFDVSIHDAQELTAVMERLESLEGIYSVSRRFARLDE